MSGLLFACPGSDCRTHLQSQPHSLGHGRLGEDGLHVGHQLAAQTAALWTNQVALLLDAGDHGEVEGEVGGDDAPDSLLLQLVVALQVYTGRQWRRLTTAEQLTQDGLALTTSTLKRAPPGALAPPLQAHKSDADRH